MYISKKRLIRLCLGCAWAVLGLPLSCWIWPVVLPHLFFIMFAAYIWRAKCTSRFHHVLRSEEISTASTLCWRTPALLEPQQSGRRFYFENECQQLGTNGPNGLATKRL